MRVEQTILEQVVPDTLPYVVDEGRFVVGSEDIEAPVLATYGLYVCKGITIYSPAQRRGLLGHLAYTVNPQASLGHMVDVYGADLSDSEVHVVQATQDRDTFCWPDLSTITGFFLEHNPRKLTVDNNPGGSPVRAIALDLRDGSVGELPMDNWGSRIPNQPDNISQVYWA